MELGKGFKDVLVQIEKDKGLPEETIISSLKAAMESAYKKFKGGNQHIEVFPAEFFRGVRQKFLGFGGKAYQQAGSADMMAQRRQYVGILDQAKRRGRARSVLLQLLLGRVGGAPVGNGRDHDRCVGGQRVLNIQPRAI